jgi:hypothetical protein
VKPLVLVLVAVAVLAFTGGTLLTPRLVTSSRSHPAVAPASRHAATDEHVDAYGNEVTNAVAQYSLDAAGSLYELHAPQIELPRLGSPKS